jgi:hypothetical protein
MINTAELLSSTGLRIGKPPGWERIVQMFASPEQCGAWQRCSIRLDDPGRGYTRRHILEANFLLTWCCSGSQRTIH